MPDSPDYSRYLPGSVRFSLQDMGELAVRQGSFNVFDRRGEVVWYDDFRHGIINYTTSLPNATAYVRLSVSERYISPFSAEISPTLLNSRYVLMARHFAVLPIIKSGVEACFSITNAFDDIRVTLGINTGTKLYAMVAILDSANNLIKLYNSSGGFTSIDTINDKVSSVDAPHFLKVVGDPETGYYSRLMFDKLSYDISTIPFYNVASANVPDNYVQFEVIGDSVFSTIVTLNHLIVTNNEP